MGVKKINKSLVTFVFGAAVERGLKRDEEFREKKRNIEVKKGNDGINLR